MEFVAGMEIHVYWKNRHIQKIIENMVRIIATKVYK